MGGWIGFYVEDADVALLHERLNADPEIAFIIQDGVGRWRAVWQVDDLTGKTMLWHVPGGALPLVMPDGQDILLSDPFAGWQERNPGMDASVPYFGAACPNTLLLELYVRGWRGKLRPDVIPLSGISWYGAMPLSSPEASTRQWWRRFRGWMRRRAVRVTRSGALDEPQGDVWAMPAALHSIRSGLERDAFPLVLFSLE
jgi:hypothetical protein